MPVGLEPGKAARLGLVAIDRERVVVAPARMGHVVLAAAERALVPGVDDVEELNSVDVKMDLANTFIEMGDSEGAREILNEIIGEADEEGQGKAKALLDSIDE